LTRSSFAAARRYCSATVRFPEDSRPWPGSTRVAESSKTANATDKRCDFGNEIIDLTHAAKEAGMKLILGMGYRGG
jgi:hypothetical protein